MVFGCGTIITLKGRGRPEHPLTIKKRKVYLIMYTIKETMFNRWHALDNSDVVCVGFIYNHVLYSATPTETQLFNMVTVEKASRNQGYALRLRIRKDHKIALLTKATPICSERYFNECVANSKYNKGEIFEKLVTENAGQDWHKDCIPMTVCGDVAVDGVQIQLKFDGATLSNEKTLNNFENRG